MYTGAVHAHVCGGVELKSIAEIRVMPGPHTIQNRNRHHYSLSLSQQLRWRPKHHASARLVPMARRYSSPSGFAKNISDCCERAFNLRACMCRRSARMAGWCACIAACVAARVASWCACIRACY